jgi:hypothetical protein
VIHAHAGINDSVQEVSDRLGDTSESEEEEVEITFHPIDDRISQQDDDESSERSSEDDKNSSGSDDSESRRFVDSDDSDKSSEKEALRDYFDDEEDDDDDDDDDLDFFGDDDDDEETPIRREKRVQRSSLAKDGQLIFSREVSVVERESTLNQRERKNRYVVLALAVFCIVAIVLVVVYFVPNGEDEEAPPAALEPTVSPTALSLNPTTMVNESNTVIIIYSVAIQGDQVPAADLTQSMDLLAPEVLAEFLTDPNSSSTRKRELTLVDVEIPTSVDDTVRSGKCGHVIHR